MSWTSSWSLADVHCDAKGVKTCQLLDGTRRFLYTADVLTYVKGDGFQIPRSLGAFCAWVDDWAVGYLTTHSERIFKRSLTAEQVKASYRPTLPDRAYVHLLKHELLAARAAPLPEPELGGGSEVRPLLQISHLWIKGGECGLTCNLEALLMQRGRSSNPTRGHMCWGNSYIPVEGGNIPDGFGVDYV